VERISRNLRPSVLDQLGLIAVLRGTVTEFGERTGVPVKLSCELPTGRLPADTELVIYRVFQEALRNVEQHARARQVTVGLTQKRTGIELVVRDDGIGFKPNRGPAENEGKGALGLIGMRERAALVGGTLTIKSARREGTEITMRVPPQRMARRRIA
jgi:signal transduction histidine kinase